MILMFTDLVGSSALKVQIGDYAYAEKIAKPHLTIFRDELLGSTEGAELIYYLGDGFFASFASVEDAVNVALRFQHALRSDPRFTIPLKVRIGIHAGQVVFVEESKEGRPPILASHAADLCARVQSLALGGQILLTRHACDDGRQFVIHHPKSENGAEPEIVWLDHGRYKFNGKDDDPLEIFEVGAKGQAPLKAPPDSEKAHREVTQAEAELLGWRPAIGQLVPRRAGWLIEKKLGEGGFGEVWLAKHDQSKQHRVFKFCFDVDRLSAFRRENTLGRLLQAELPQRRDIARLYEVQLDAPPYFLESEYHPGGNLYEWAENNNLAQQPLRERLRLMTEIAKAVGAAHSVGVIHKDIKPSNILMRQDNDGWHPILADFGIGALADRSQLQRHGITVGGFTASLLTPGSSHTGTWMYRPPEASHGEMGAITSDIYSLGVVFYQLLLGNLDQPLGVGWEKRLRVSLEKSCTNFGESAIVTELLEQDVRECVAESPAERISSALEVAKKLEQLDRRIQGEQRQRRIHALNRRAKWFGAASVFFALLSIAMLWGAKLINDERQRSESLRVKVERQNTILENTNIALDKERANANRTTKLALDALNQLASGVQEKIESQPRTLELRKDLLTTARNGLKAILEEARKQGTPDQTLVWVHLQMGDVETYLGDVAAAQREYRLGLEVAEENATKAPGSIKEMRDLSACYQRLGDIEVALGQSEKALECFSRFHDCCKAIVAADPQSRQYQLDLAQSFNRLGDISRELGRTQEAITNYQHFFDICSQLDQGNDLNASQQLAVALDKLGRTLLHNGQGQSALVKFKDALKIREHLAQLAPTDRRNRYDLAYSFEMIGDAWLQINSQENAEDAYSHSLSLRQKLSDEDQADVKAQKDVAGSLKRLGDLAMQFDRMEVALENYRKSLEIQEKLSSKDERNTELLRDQSVTLDRLVTVAFNLGLKKESEDYAQKSLKIALLLSERDPASIEKQRDLSISYEKIGDLRLDAGDFEEVNSNYSKSLEIRQILARKDALNLQAKSDLFVIFQKLGILEYTRGEYAKALEYLQEGREALQVVLRQSPHSSEFAKYLPAIEAQIEACALESKAVEDLEFVFAQDQEAITNLAFLRVKHLLRKNRAPDAIATAFRFSEWSGRLEVDAHEYDAACIFALCAAADEPQRNTLIEQCLMHLESIKANGFFGPKRVAHLKLDPHFDGVRTHIKFVDFMKNLEVVKPNGPSIDSPASAESLPTSKSEPPE